MAASGKKWPDGSGLNHMSGATDPLLAALIGKLPETAKPWARADRIAWLEMMAKAFDVVYGREESGIDEDDWLKLARGRIAWVKPSLQGDSPAATRQAHDGYDFYIAKDGTAHQADGSPALLVHVSADETIFDYRPVTGEFRDRDGIVWADGQRGVAGLAPGCSFAGPG